MKAFVVAFAAILALFGCSSSQETTDLETTFLPETLAGEFPLVGRMSLGDRAEVGCYSELQVMVAVDGNLYAVNASAYYDTDYPDASRSPVVIQAVPFDTIDDLIQVGRGLCGS